MLIVEPLLQEVPLRSTPGAVGSIFMSLIQLKTPKIPYVSSFSAIKTDIITKMSKNTNSVDLFHFLSTNV